MNIGRLDLSRALLFAACMLSLPCASSARAGLIFEFGQTAYESAPNTTVSVEVYLRATDADRNYLLSTSAGRLFSIGIRVNNNQIATGANVLSAADITPNTTVFDDPVVTPVTDVGAGFARMAAFTNDPDGVSLPDTNPLRVLVGTFKYTLGTNLGVATTLSFEDFDGTSNIVASDGLGGVVELDGLVNFTGTATITAVPEPATMSLFALAGSLGLLRARLRRTKAEK